MAMHDRMWAINIYSQSLGPFQDRITVSPPHGAQDVPRVYPFEATLAVDGTYPGAGLGMALIVSVRMLRRMGRDVPQAPIVELYEHDRRGRRTHAVTAELHYPGNGPVNGSPRNFGIVSFVPLEPLKARTWYSARAEVWFPSNALPYQGNHVVYEWKFKTASD